MSRRCPKCGKEIDYLYYYAYELQKATFYISSNNHAEYSNWDSFTSEEEAEKFLRGNSNEMG